MHASSAKTVLLLLYPGSDFRFVINFNAQYINVCSFAQLLKPSHPPSTSLCAMIPSWTKKVVQGVIAFNVGSVAFALRRKVKMLFWGNSVVSIYGVGTLACQ